MDGLVIKHDLIYSYIIYSSNTIKIQFYTDIALVE